MDKIEATERELAAALSEWDRRYREEPDRFLSEAESAAAGSDSYGAAAAPYLISIIKELRAPRA